MDILSVFLIGVGLSMDACAVSLAKGMTLPKEQTKKYAFILAFAFGFFQFLMPVLGYIAGAQFASYIESIDHWIAFILLGIIGINMIRESNEDEESGEAITSISFKDVIVLAIATSIDALAIGVSFAFLNVNILSSALLIGCTTFTMSFVCVFIGKKLGSIFQKYAQRLGGLILIAIGIKILIEHLFF